jgi:hypothetical protein
MQREPLDDRLDRIEQRQRIQGRKIDHLLRHAHDDTLSPEALKALADLNAKSDELEAAFDAAHPES